jgi:hypothetical protein
MAKDLPSVVSLNEFQSSPYFLLQELGPGTYEQVSEIRGNSILSSIFVESIDAGATLQVNYYDTTTGAAVGERFDIGSHDLVTDGDVGQTIRALFGRIHRRVVAEVIITGGNIKFSLYATAVTSTASDIDSALIRDGEDYTDPEDKAIPVAYLDEATQKLFFVRGENGALKVTGTVTALAGGKGTPNSRIVDLPLDETEYAIAFPTNCVSFCVSNEATNVRIKASWKSGETSTNYFTIKPGQIYQESGLVAPNLTLYVQSNKPNAKLNIVEWT